MASGGGERRVEPCPRAGGPGIGLGSAAVSRAVGRGVRLPSTPSLDQLVIGRVRLPSTSTRVCGACAQWASSGGDAAATTRQSSVGETGNERPIPLEQRLVETRLALAVEAHTTGSRESQRSASGVHLFEAACTFLKRCALPMLNEGFEEPKRHPLPPSLSLRPSPSIPPQLLSLGCSSSTRLGANRCSINTRTDAHDSTHLHACAPFV